MRVAALLTCAVSPASFRSKVFLSRCRRQLNNGSTSLSKSSRRWHSLGCSIRTQATGNFDRPSNLATLLNTLVDSLHNTSSATLKEFPWKKARSILAERLLVFGKEALKWSLAVLFATSFLSDILMAISGNRELMIPLGLFTGVMLADFLKESFQEFFGGSIKEGAFPPHLLGAGSFFVFVKFLSLCLNVQARTLLSHIGNGGLMQVLWLAREQQQQVDNVEIQREQELVTAITED